MKDQSPSQLSPWRRTLLFLRRSTRSGALRVDHRFATVRVASSLVFLLATSLVDLQHFRPTLAKGLEQNQEVRGPSLHSAELPDGSNAPRAQLRGEQAQSYHLATGIAIASRIQTADSASGAESPGHSLAITLAPNERIRIPVGLEGGISAWKLCLEVDGWWQVLQVEIFEGRREPEASSKPASSNAPGFTSISDRQWRPRLDELVNTLHGGPVAARHFTREIFFISNRSEAYLELTNRSQSQTVNIARVYALPIPVRSEANSAQEPPHPLQDALITEYLSTDDSLRLLAASRRLEKRLSEKPSSGNQESEINASDATQQLQSAIQSWLQYAKDRGVTCLSVPVVFRRGSLYASEHVFKRPLGNVPHSPDTLITDEQVVERFPSIDLVEQLYRACHSTGILFCPVIDLSFPISELEPLSSKVVETPYRNPKIPAQASAWNPQSQTVHQALTELLQELPKRYGALPGYCGFSVTVDPNSAWWMELDTEAMHPELIAEATRALRRLPASSPEQMDAPNPITAKEFQNWQTDRLLKTLALSTPDLVRIYGPTSSHLQNFASRWQFMAIENSLGSTPRNMLNDWWNHGIHPKCYSLESEGNRERYYQTQYCSLPVGDSLQQLKPIARARDLQSPDRIRIWSLESTKNQGISINANPWTVNLQIQWSENPGEIHFRGNDFELVREIESAANGRFTLTHPLPPSSLLNLSWSNENAQIISWNNAKDQTIEHVHRLLASFESALTSLSVPQSEGGLLFNGGFELPPEERSLQISKGWAMSLNSQAPFRRVYRLSNAENDCLVLDTQQKPQSVWLQSEAFETDRSRLQVSAWIALSSTPLFRSSTRPAPRLRNSSAINSSIHNLSVSVLLWNPQTARFENVATQSLAPTRQMDQEWQQWTADLSGPLASILKDGQKHRIKLHWQLVCEGIVQLDNLNASSDFLLEPERVELRNRLFVAKQLLKESNIDASIRLLEHSWPRLLRTSPRN